MTQDDEFAADMIQQGADFLRSRGLLTDRSGADGAPLEEYPGYPCDWTDEHGQRMRGRFIPEPVGEDGLTQSERIMGANGELATWQDAADTHNRRSL